MRICWHSNAPWTTTAYGQQTAIWTRLLRDAGHEVVISAFYGLNGEVTTWNGMTVLPPGQNMYGGDILPLHAERMKADLVITLMDIWVLVPEPIRNLPVAHWMPVDCSPLSAMDRRCLNVSGATPVATSRFGERMLREAGYSPYYVPHGIDATGTFTPPADRAALREEMGLSGRFVVGINAANKDLFRKGFPEQMAAFARFRKRHPEALLLAHTVTAAPDGLNLLTLADSLGIRDAVRFSDQYAYLTGMARPADLAKWYGAIDVLSACSYGEGFGLPLAEAQACGTPVVTTDGSAMAELCGAGWKVPGEPWWNARHEAWWTRPSIDGIARAYERAFEHAGRKREQARAFALTYDTGRVLDEHWIPVLATLGDAASERKAA